MGPLQINDGSGGAQRIGLRKAMIAACNLAAGVILLLSSLLKAIVPIQNTAFFDLTATPIFIYWALVFLEWTIGYALLVGFMQKFAGLAAAVLFLAFGIFHTQDIVSPLACNCFGPISVPRMPLMVLEFLLSIGLVSHFIAATRNATLHKSAHSYCA